MDFRKFFDEVPSNQNAIDIFEGHWASSLPEDQGDLKAGMAPIFTADPRPQLAVSRLGDEFHRFDGFRILELGPLEGGHTFQLEKLGAHVISIEGNAEAYLKCLIIKEIFSLKASFRLGNFIKFLEASDTKFDLVFACGVLYHMVEPLELIRLICRATDRCFIWSHYYDPEICSGYLAEEVECSGYKALHYAKNYNNRDSAQFWGGLDDGPRWLTRDDIIGAFKHFGHVKVEVLSDSPQGQNGPSFSIVTRR